MQRRSLLVLLIGLMLCGSSLFAASPEEALYVVTVRPSEAVEGTRAVGAQMAAAYGGTVVKEGSVHGDAFVMRLAVGRARVVAADPRVLSVTLFRPAVNVVTEIVPWTAGVSYGYDGAGDIAKIGPDAFAYDDVGRLVQATINSVQRNYTYDAFGNRTACAQTGPMDCQGLTFDDTSRRQNHLKEATYDGSGNVQSVPLWGHSYTYDAFNMLTQDAFGQLAREYVYTADDERLATYAVTTKTWRWTVRETSGKVLRELSSRDGSSVVGTSSWQWLKDYVWRDGLLLASRQAESNSTTTYHYHLDHLGTPRRITDQNDQTVGVHDYYAYGPEVSTSTAEPSVTALKYTGQERDIWTADSFDTLDYMHTRYYSPGTGRFISVDRHLGDPDTPQTWNRYAYARGNTLKYIDQNGEDAILVVRDNAAGGLTNFGHTALRVYGKGYDYTFDFGRYGEHHGLFESQGEGILRVWTDFSKFLAAERTGDHLKGVHFITTPQQDQAMLD